MRLTIQNAGSTFDVTIEDEVEGWVNAQASRMDLLHLLKEVLIALCEDTLARANPLAGRFILRQWRRKC